MTNSYLLGAIVLAGAAAAAAQQPTQAGRSHFYADIAPAPTSPPIVRREADLDCASSVGTQLQILSSVDPALSSFVQENQFEAGLGEFCTATVPFNLTEGVKSVYSAESTWAKTVSSKAAGIHTDCGNGSPITISLQYNCVDGVTIVGTGAGKEAQTSTFPGITGPSNVVVGKDSSAGSRAAWSWAALVVAVGFAAMN